MGSLAMNADERVASVGFTEHDLVVGRRISVPLEWYPRLAHVTPEQLRTLERVQITANNGIGPR
ncbi:DUF2442 domain-containing protein [Thioalkalivibrio sp. AKL10]|uniref:DUF2442 domain-containing protein n=1 Tax=Thioalkalivibrio sp. AKL10 TaxID=1158158 RepID=UPI0009DAD7BE